MTEAASLQISLRQAQVAAQFSGEIHPVLQRVLLNRGIGHSTALQHDLQHLADPFLMRGMSDAVARLLQALRVQEKIIVVGDFDADGATSCALMLRALQAMGFTQVSFMVPNRFEYGYGLSARIVDELAWQKPSLLITVDNGISSVEGVAKAKTLGMDVIVTDHHLPGAVLPAAVAIVNPNQQGCDFPSKALAGVGVVFHLLMALRKTLREQGWFTEQAIAEPNLADYLDLVALGTVADVVPMDSYNRILVVQGLKRIRANRMCMGIRQLLQVAGKDYRHLVSSDLGFTVGPRLNAAGRLDDMTQGILLLLSDSEELTFELAQAMDGFNRDRRAIEGQMQIEAMRIVDSLTEGLEEIPRGFCLYHPQWHQGVVGLVASKIKERFHRPVIAFAPADDAGSVELKGSGRSIKGLHLRDLLDRIACDNPGLLDKFGGHAMAAGLSLPADALPAFELAFHQSLAAIDDEEIFQRQLWVDGELPPPDFTLTLAQLLRDAMPWGQQLPAPLFTGRFSVLDSRVLTGKHLKLSLARQADLAPVKTAIDAIWFNASEDFLQQTLQGEVELAFRLEINFFRGEQKLQLMIESLSCV